MKRTLWRHKRRQLIDHPQRTADQDLLSGRDGFLQKGFQHMTARAVLRRINALSHSKVNSQLTSTYANVCHSHHFEVALSSGRIVGAQTQFAVNVQLAHVGVVLADVETESAVRVFRIGTNADREISRAGVADEHQACRPIRVGIVRHPALFRHDLDVRH